jgi:putative peptide zinc metalloprotease protein
MAQQSDIQKEQSEILKLPPLREDLQIEAGLPDDSGTPTWTIYDPPAHKYYRIDWTAFECLARFRNSQNAEELIRRVNEETTLNIDESVVKDLINFLSSHQLLRVNTPEAVGRFGALRRAKNSSAWKKALHGYLFFTVPLFHPQNFLESALPLVRPLLGQRFVMIMLIMLAAGLYLTAKRFDEFIGTFSAYFNLEGVLLVIITTIFVKALHELGHAFVATKHGVKVPVIGAAFIVMCPVLYTETTGAWQLSDRRKRVQIAAAGIMTEIALAAIALWAWHIFPEGPGRSMAFFVAFVSLAGSLLVNLNPLMKFDGYYLLSDALGIENLQDRACAFAKWRLRRLLWGWRDEAPEELPLKRERFFQLFGFALWIYRFFLFAGIALLLHALFFPPLNVILMSIELGVFIGLPVWKEIRVWWKERHKMRRSLPAALTISAAVLLMLAFVLPVQGHVTVPAVMHNTPYAYIFPPVSGKIEALNIHPGKHVEKGEVLAVLISRKLEQQLSVKKLEFKKMTDTRRRVQASRSLSLELRTLDEKIDALHQKIEGLKSQKERLVLKAPFSGIAVDLLSDLHKGRYINEKQRIATLIRKESKAFAGYIDEQNRERLPPGSTGIFYPDISLLGLVKVKVSKIEENNTGTLAWPELATSYGGPLAIDTSSDNKTGNQSLVPRKSLYLVKVEPVPDENNQIRMPENMVRGVIKLEAQKQSPLLMFLKRLVSVFIREISF